MEKLQINATEDTPCIVCNTDGLVSIEGRSLTEDPVAFYKSVFDWISSAKLSVFNFEIKLEYINTSSSKQLFKILELAKSNHWKAVIQVKWFYEETDEDGLEFGKELESTLEIPFEYLKVRL